MIDEGLVPKYAEICWRISKAVKAKAFQFFSSKV